MAWNGRNESILGSKPGKMVDVVAPPTEAAARSRGNAAADDVANVAKAGTATTTTSSLTDAAVPQCPPPSAPPVVNAWNGRNSTIIAKAKDATVPAGGEGRAGASPSPAIITQSSVAAAAAAAAATTTPGPDHDERDESGNEPVAVVVVVGHPGPPTPSTSPLSADEDVVVGTTGRNPRSRRRKDHHQQIQQQQQQQQQRLQERRRSKEDEATNSTAGSTAGSTAASFSGAVGVDGIDAPEDDALNPPSLEGNTVVTMNTTTTSTAGDNVESSSATAAPRPDHHPTEGRKKRDVGINKKKGKSLPSSSPSPVDGAAPASARGAPNVPNGTGKNGRGGGGRGGDDDSNNRKNSTSSAPDSLTSGNNGGRRSGGGVGTNNRNGGQQQRQSGKGHAVLPPSSSRGNKKATSDADVAGGRPICAFHVRGMCNRGASCAFRHDPTTSNADGTCPVVAHRGDDVDRSANATAPSSHVRGLPRREFDPHKAKAIQLAKEAQDREDRSAFFASSAKTIWGGRADGVENGEGEEKQADENGLDPPFFSIDVECVATGYGSCANGINDGVGNAGREGEGVPPEQYNDNSHRYPGRVALVDSDGNVLADIVIRPPGNGAGVVSYLTPLTGLTAEICLGPDSVPLDDAVRAIRALLPPNGVIVGQAIGHDVTWLGLRSGTDYDRTLDISDIFRQRVPAVLAQAAGVVRKRAEDGGDEEKDLSSSSSSSCDRSSDEFLGFATRYRCFSLRHVCLNLLGEDIQKGVHDPVTDAKYSLMLFHKYRNSSPTQLRIVRDGLHRAPITPGFAAEKTPVIDGVCVSALGYPYKRAARKIWRWYSSINSSSVGGREQYD